ncbi:MAG: cytochrome P450 [Deltaproteobacteria bacterium]|nr:cytochrome P450 [Deltaproteobacteria bacterium]MBW2698435.1 cytochrome P450 [Deltaproteobacteria bacterium]
MSQQDPTPERRDSVESGWYGADPDDPVHLEDPHPGFGILRESQPVNLTPWENWRLSRYDDCVRLLRELPCGMRRTDGLLPGQSPEDPVGPPSFMLLQDPPAHTRLRKLVAKAFTPRAVESWRPRIEAITGELLDGVAERGSMDLIKDLALPVPATLICELLGVPVEDRDTFTEWTADATHGLVTIRGGSPPEIVERVEHARNGLAGYFNELIVNRRSHPSDDLLSMLIAAEEDGDKLSPPELLTNCIGLLIAGFETTIGLIGNGLITLLHHPDELAKLRAQPELIESTVEECLRFSGPILMTVRVLHADAEFNGIRIPCNAEVTVVLAAANRDPRRFLDPERFDIERYARRPAPTPHLAFGGGVHHCLGAHLARLETQIAIGALVRRFDELALIHERTEWGRSLFRVPATIPVTFAKAD